MGQREFTQWLAFHILSPIDDERCFDLPAALQRHTLISLHTPRGKSTPPIQELLPYALRPQGLNDFEREILRWAEREGRQEQ